MKTSYYDVENATTAHLWEVKPGEYLLTELQTGRHHRGQGHAGRLLERVLEDADREGAILYASVQPDGSLGSLDYEQLVAFYSRRGFREIEPGAMRRPPRPL